MPSPSHHPHDRFFRSAFAFKELMEEYVESFLPKELVSNFHLDTLKQQKESFLDKNLQQYFSDVVYTVGYGKSEVMVTLLLEHKSYVPPHPWLQLLRYLMNAFDAQARQKDFRGKFQPVIPIIIYHGDQRWQVRPVSGYFDGMDEQLRPFVPEFQYLLNDLSEVRDEELLAMDGSLVSRTFLALKLSRMKDELRRVSLVFQDFSEKDVDFSKSNFIQLIFVYLLQSGTSKKTIMRAIDEINSPVKNKVMSAYDQIIEEGRLQAAFETFKKGLSMRLPLKDLIALAGISKERALEWQELINQNPGATLPLE